MVSEEMIFKCFFFFILVSVTINKMSSRPKIIWQIEHCLKNISMKVLSKYLERLGSKCLFSIFPIISLWKLYCHSKQTKELNFIKNTKPVKCNMVNISIASRPHRAYGF